ncbi:MAG: AAA family ATPase [Gemmatimonadales bacterium]|nr:MAG: AAA family ATPase [Gemmatimonadales bacterium]
MSPRSGSSPPAHLDFSLSPCYTFSTTMAASPPQSLDFTEELITGILPRDEVSILAGASGAGKTTLIMQILRSLTRNEPVFGRPTLRDIRLGYIAADRTWRSYQKTAAHVGLDLSSIGVRALVDDPAIDLKLFEASPIEELERLIGLLLPCDLIVVDPLVVFLGVDTNKYHLNAARLIRLNKLCRTNHVTLLGTHHATKARSDYSFKRAQDRISGTSALLGFTSTQLFLAAPEETEREDGCAEWHIISHHAAPTTILLNRGEGGTFEWAGEESLNQALSLEDRLLGFMRRHAPDPVTTGDLLNHLSSFASPRSIERTLADLRASSMIHSPSKGQYLVDLVGGATH